MNDKTIRYIGVGIGYLVTLSILYIEESPLRYDFFASDISSTIIYNLSKDILREFGLRWRDARDLAYLIWFFCLAGGVWFSWKIRFKIVSVMMRTVSVMMKIFKKIDEKV